ncbi:MAG: hypothetical protein ACUVWS_14010 [Roseiflexus sp.]
MDSLDLTSGEIMQLTDTRQKVDNSGLIWQPAKSGWFVRHHLAIKWDMSTGLPMASVSATTGTVSKAHPSTAVSGMTTSIGLKRNFRQIQRTFTVTTLT